MFRGLLRRMFCRCGMLFLLLGFYFPLETLACDHCRAATVQYQVAPVCAQQVYVAPVAQVVARQEYYVQPVVQQYVQPVVQPQVQYQVAQPVVHYQKQAVVQQQVQYQVAQPQVVYQRANVVAAVKSYSANVVAVRQPLIRRPIFQRRAVVAQPVVVQQQVVKQRHHGRANVVVNAGVY